MDIKAIIAEKTKAESIISFNNDINLGVIKAHFFSNDQFCGSIFL